MSTHTEFGCNIDELDEGMGSLIIPSGPVGPSGNDGNPGSTPYIQDDYWFINGVTTGIKATGNQGTQGIQGIQGISGTGATANDVVTNFSNASVFYTDLKEFKKLIYPSGMISMWSGDPSTHFNTDGTGKLNETTGIDMRGWGLCEVGTYINQGFFYPRGNMGAGYYSVNGVAYPIPDLSSRFIVGYSSNTHTNDIAHAYIRDNAYNAVGFKSTTIAKTLTLDETNLPEHTHNLELVITSNALTKTTLVGDPDGGFVPSSSTQIEDTGTNTSTNVPIDTRPPFYVLAFIMKIDELE